MSQVKEPTLVHPDLGWGCQKGARGNNNIIDNYELVMHGTVFQIEDLKDGNGEVTISFGGLLLNMKGDMKLLKEFEMHQDLFLLANKI